MTDRFRPRGWPHSIFKFIIAGVVILNLVVAGIGWFSLQHSRAHYDERAVVIAQNIAKILDENLTGILAKVDVSMLAVVDEAERQLATGSIQEAAFSRFIVRAHARLPEIAVFRATDAVGEATYGPAAVAAKTMSLAHRDYFKFLQETPNSGLVISKPLVGGISGKWMIILARRINRPDGAFAGLVYTGVTIDQLTKSFAAIDVGQHGSIALIDSDSSLVARHPEDPVIAKWVGRKIPSQQLIDLIEMDRSVGTYSHKSSLDGIERSFSLRRVGLTRPFFLLVGMANTDYLAGWRTEAWKLSIFMGIFLCLTVLLAALIQRGWYLNEQEFAGQVAAQTILTLQKEELEATLARTKRLEGIISICMHCKKINNQQESWEQMEKYISEHSDAQFSHGICPGCFEEHYPSIERKNKS